MTWVKLSKRLVNYHCIITGQFAIFPWQLKFQDPQFIGLWWEMRSSNHVKIWNYISLRKIWPYKFCLLRVSSKTMACLKICWTTCTLTRNGSFLLLTGIITTLTQKKNFFGIVQHKRHIIKVMCLVAVAQPWFDTECHCMWDGKLGIWTFPCQVPAKKNSKTSQKVR